MWRVARADLRRMLGIGAVGATLYAAMVLAAAWVLAFVTDEVVLPAVDAGEVTARDLTVIGLAIVGVSAVKAAGIFGRRFGAYLVQYSTQATFRRQVTRAFMRLPMAWHRRHPTGQLLSNAVADIEAATFVAAPMPMALASTILIVVAAIALLVTDPFLAAVGFVVGPALIAVNLAFQRRMRARVARAQQTRGAVSAIAHESFDSALVVKTLGRERAETDRFAATSNQLRDEMIEVGRLRAIFDPMIEALPNVGILLVLVVGAWRVQTTDLTAGDLIGFAYLFRLSAIPLRVFGWLLGDIPRAVVGFERIDHVLDAEPEPDDGSGQVPPGNGADVVAAGLSYHHPVEDHLDARGLEGVDLMALRGQTVAIVGPTGAGKSTLAWLLARLLEPQAGGVTIDGADLRDVARDALAESISIVFQESFIFDDTVTSNITLGGDWTHGDVVEAADLAQAHGFVNHLADGYDTVVGERGATLSGGQRQRIALARALVRRPRLLILDDATSACDPSVEAAILERLSSADLPATVLLIAHRSGSIGLADQVLFLDEGRVVAQGTHVELMASAPGYRQLITAYERRAAERARKAAR